MAAIFVLVGHQFPIFGAPASTPVLLGKGLHVIGVEIFFTISGYLILASWNDDPHPIRFFARRSLRIFPGLIAVCLVSVFVLGPLFTSKPIPTYLTDKGTYFYFWNATLYTTYRLPGVFEQVPLKGVVNGSLWSLPAEYIMYGIVALGGSLWLLLRFDQRPLWVAALLAGSAAKVATQDMPLSQSYIVWGTSLVATIDAGVYFLAGALIKSIENLHAPRLGLALVSIPVLTVLPSSAAVVLDPLLFSYVVIALGASRAPVISHAGRYGDFSYGIYLYAFPVQQAAYALGGGTWSATAWLLPVLVATVGLAALSWYFVEKPALRLKPRRGPRPAAGRNVGRALFGAPAPTGELDTVKP